MDIKVKSHLKPCAALSIAIMIVALVMTLTGHGMNLGVDFTGGTIMTYNMGEQFETADVEAVLADNGITDAQIAKTGDNDTQVQIRISDKENTDDLRSALESKLGEKYTNMEYVDISRVGAIAGRDLINNAIKYTPVGSVIEIHTEQKNKWVIVSVADNGPGIPDEQKPRVFDMFYSGANKVVDSRRSLGLGLSLCKSIVTAHGGTISVSDNQPNGTVFTFTLPAGEVELHE